jgi:mRNA interferase RelE/StbE
MATTTVVYTEHARKDLLTLDKPVARRIVLKIKENSELHNPLTRAKALTGVLEGLHRYRVGDFRAIFEYDDKGIVRILTVLKIQHRKSVYKS